MDVPTIAETGLPAHHRLRSHV